MEDYLTEVDLSEASSWGLATKLAKRLAASNPRLCGCWSKSPTMRLDAGRFLTRPEKIRVTAGTTLIREWHGARHQVTVLKDGFLYRAKRFRSLSLIARTITDSRWSGPLFFGLKSSGKGQNSEAA